MIINIDGGNGGGGGGYVLPVASASVLGGVKVGSGLTIDNAGMLSTSGGSAGGGDYMVVSELPESAENGQLFFVPAHMANVPLTAYTLDCSEIAEEGYVAEIDGTAVYWTPGSPWFHWEWGENTGQFEEKPWGGFIANPNDAEFIAFVDDPSIITINEGVSYTTAVTSTTREFLDETYRYVVSAFTKEENVINIPQNGDAMFGTLMSLYQAGVDLSQKSYTIDGRPAVFDSYDSENIQFIFRLPDNVEEPVGAPLIYYNKLYAVRESGSDWYNRNSVQLPVFANIDLSTSGLSGGMWVRTVSNLTEYGGNPVILRGYDNGQQIWSQNVWFRPFYDPDKQDWASSLGPEEEEYQYNGYSIFGSEFYYKGKKIVAEWFVNVDGGTLLNWSETQVSAQDSEPPTV